MFCSCSNGWTLSLRIQPPWPLRPSRTYPSFPFQPSLTTPNRNPSFLLPWACTYTAQALHSSPYFENVSPSLRLKPHLSFKDQLMTPAFQKLSGTSPLLSVSSFVPLPSLSTLQPHWSPCWPTQTPSSFSPSLHLAGCTTGFLFFRF